MRRLILLGLVVFCLPMAVYAAGISGAETLGQGKIAVGLDQEFVFDRDMKLKSIDPALDPGETVETKPEISSMCRTMVKTSYGLLENLDIYVKLGTTDFKGKMPWTWTESGDSETGLMRVKGDSAFAYGFGLKGAYNLENDWIVGCDVQYLRHKNDYKGVDLGDWGEESFKGNVIFREWQVAPYVAKKIGNFVPYLGVKYSDLRTKFKVIWEDDEVETWKMKADNNIGIFLGTDYKFTDNWKLNVEGRFVDETAMNVACVYRF